MFRSLSAVLVSLCLCSAVLSEEKADRERDGEKAEVFAKNIAILTKMIAKAKKVRLYEGLPHQTFEGDLLEKELKEKKTVKRHGFPFYAEAIAPKEEVAKALLAVCEDPKAFGRYTGPKKCGGFHPDWCVEFDDGLQKVSVLVCFGCGEARLYGPKIDAFSDLGAGAKKLTETLTALRKNRPKQARE